MTTIRIPMQCALCACYEENIAPHYARSTAPKDRTRHSRRMPPCASFDAHCEEHLKNRDEIRAALWVKGNWRVVLRQN